MKQLEEKLKDSHVMANEKKRLALAEKDDIIADLSRALMSQGSDLMLVEKKGIKPKWSGTMPRWS